MRRLKKPAAAAAAVIVIIGAAAAYFAVTRQGIHPKGVYSGTLEAHRDSWSDTERREHDLEFLYTEIRDCYANLKYKEDLFGFDWDTVYAGAKSRLSSITSESDFYILLCEMTALLRDGHLNLNPNYSDDAVYDALIGTAHPYYDEVSQALGIRLIGEGRAVVYSSAAGPEALGQEVTAVCGVPLAEILDTMLRYDYHSSNDRGAKNALLESGDYLRYFSFTEGLAPPRVLEYTLTDAEGLESVLSVDTEDPRLGETVSADVSFGRADGVEVTWEILSGVGVIRVPTFDSTLADVTVGFDAALRALEEAGAKAALIDLRGNGGGDESYREVLSRLASEPFVSGSFRYRDCARFRALFWLRPLVDRFRSVAGTLDLDMDGYTGLRSMKVRPENASFLTGLPVAVLADDTIFSSAHDFVRSCLDQDLAFVVGNPGAASGFGLAVDISFPGGDYTLRYGMYEGFDANGKAMENAPLIPDLYVEQTLEDFRKGIDTQKEAALAYLRGRISG